MFLFTSISYWIDWIRDSEQCLTSLASDPDPQEKILFWGYHGLLTTPRIPCQNHSAWYSPASTSSPSALPSPARPSHPPHLLHPHYHRLYCPPSLVPDSSAISVFYPSSLSASPSYCIQRGSNNLDTVHQHSTIVRGQNMDSLIPFTTSGSLVDCVDSTSVLSTSETANRNLSSHIITLHHRHVSMYSPILSA